MNLLVRTATNSKTAIPCGIPVSNPALSARMEAQKRPSDFWSEGLFYSRPTANVDESLTQSVSWLNPSAKMAAGAVKTLFIKA